MNNQQLTVGELARILVTSPVWETIEKYINEFNKHQVSPEDFPLCEITEEKFGMNIIVKFATKKDNSAFNPLLIKSLEFKLPSRENTFYDLHKKSHRQKSLPEVYKIIIEKYQLSFQAQTMLHQT